MDEKLLLTPEQLKEFQVCHIEHYGDISVNEVDWRIIDMLKAQLAKDEARFAKERPLIEKAERERVEARYDNDYMEIVREEGRKAERERILGEAEKPCPHYGKEGNNWIKRCCDECWQALKSS